MRRLHGANPSVEDEGWEDAGPPLAKRRACFARNYPDRKRRAGHARACPLGSASLHKAGRFVLLVVSVSLTCFLGSKTAFSMVGIVCQLSHVGKERSRLANE